MKVCIISHFAYGAMTGGATGHIGGVERQTTMLARWLARRDHEVTLLTWDEGQGNHSCCGLPESAGGRVATVLISPQVKSNFQDETPYSHYSILKTIVEAWDLPALGHAADTETSLIAAPWK